MSQWVIWLAWFSVGLVFGLATQKRREHLGGGTETPGIWLLICIFLWPVIVVDAAWKKLRRPEAPMNLLKRLATVCAAGVAPSLIPGLMLNTGQPFPSLLLFAAASAIGGSLLACAAGGVALFAARGRADKGARTAALVAFTAGVLLAAASVYGLRS